LIHVFHGDDSFSIHEALRALREAVGPREAWDSNISRFEGDSFDLNKFAGAAMVMPFLGERRLVIVHGLLTAAESQRPARRGQRARPEPATSPHAQLAGMLEQLPPTTDVAFVDGALKRDNPLLAALGRLGGKARMVEFQPPRHEGLEKWVRDRAAAREIAISNEAVSLMAEYVGGDLWQMSNEIEKLAVHAGGRPIEAEAVRALVSTARESTVFELVDAVMERRLDAALAHLERLLRDGSSGQSLIAMIARQARLVALAQALMRERVPQVEWGRRLGIQQEFVLRKTADQARRFSEADVRGLYRLLLAADLAMKTGETTDELALVDLLTRAVGLRSPSVRR